MKVETLQVKTDELNVPAVSRFLVLQEVLRYHSNLCFKKQLEKIGISFFTYFDENSVDILSSVFTNLHIFLIKYWKQIIILKGKLKVFSFQKGMRN